MEKVIAIVGPTAVGKTALSIVIAKALGGEIVSADSRQVYCGLDIGTGKATPAEREGVAHHLIDVADPREVFSAADYVRLGRAAISDIAARGHVPIVVGGTGFYIDTLLGRMTLAEVPPDPELRDELGRLNLPELREKMKALDPKRYRQIDIKNRRRLERAIEIASSPRDEKCIIYDTPQYQGRWIGLSLPLPDLAERIRTRLTRRLGIGMLQEAQKLLTEGLSYRRMDELGLEYRYMARHLIGTISYNEMIEQLEKEIVAYAKRQMTWFKKNKEIQWFPPDDFQKCTAYVKEWYGKG